MSVYREVKRNALGNLERLAKGGTAIIYGTPDVDFGVGPLVYKEYTAKTRAHAGEAALTAGLRRFVRFRETLAPPQRRLWDERVVWPIAVVIGDDGQASGVLMPRISDGHFHDFPKVAGGHERKPLNIEVLFGDDNDPPAKHMPKLGIAERLQLVSAVTHAYGLMHKVDVVLGDISGTNVVFNLHSSPLTVLVVDVDGARIKGNRALAGSQAHTPNWESPEALLATARLRRLAQTGGSADDIRRQQNAWSIQTMESDVYKLGLMVTRLLDYGRTRSRNRNPQRACQVLCSNGLKDVATILELSLHDDPSRRPKIRDWYDALQHRGNSSPKPGTVTIPAPSQPAGSRQRIADGTRKGQWVWTEGVGWTRSTAGTL